MIYFTADHHFGHDKIIEYCDRPFENVAHMNTELIKRWNETVDPNDVVYHLGDFTLRDINYAKTLFNMLNGRINVVPGGHDKSWMLHPLECKSELRHNVTILPPLYTIPILRPRSEGGDLLFVLCHYAMRTWDRQHYGSIQLFGHSHGKLQLPLAGRQLDVGVDVWDYAPVSMEQVLEKLGVR